MNELDRPSARTWRPGRRGALAGAALSAIVLAAGATVATADGPIVSKNSNGSVGIDASRVTPYYNGERTTVREIKRLNSEGKAMIGINDRALACQGISLYVDTTAQLAAYELFMKPYTDKRNNAIKAAVAAGRPFVEPSGEPCAGLPTTVPDLPPS